MLEETGRVVSVEADGVWVETIKVSACSSCSARNGCGQKLLASVGEGKRALIRVDNPDQLVVKAEDEVKIGIGEHAFMHMSLMLYLVPLLTLFAGAVVAHFAGAAEPLVILSALAGLAVGFVSVRFISRRYMTSCKYHPVLLKTL